MADAVATVTHMESNHRKFTTTGETVAPFTYPVGAVVRLTASAEVTIGETVNIDLHPSGSAFDGPAVVVAAFMSSTPGVGPYVEVVALGDPTHRRVGRRYDDVLPLRPMEEDAR